MTKHETLILKRSLVIYLNRTKFVSIEVAYKGVVIEKIQELQEWQKGEMQNFLKNLTASLR